MIEPVVAMGAFSYRYPGAGEAALDEIELELREGELTVLCGPSGCTRTA